MPLDAKSPGVLKPRIIEPFGLPTKPLVASQDRATLAILRNPDFETLVRERTSFGWTLSIVMLAVYLTFIFLVAFAQDLMATKLAGTEISLGILLGFCVIVFAVLLTGIYVWRANGRFDDLTRSLRKAEGQ